MAINYERFKVASQMEGRYLQTAAKKAEQEGDSRYAGTCYKLAAKFFLEGQCPELAIICSKKSSEFRRSLFVKNHQPIEWWNSSFKECQFSIQTFRCLYS
jgi:hypothetical protein